MRGWHRHSPNLRTVIPSPPFVTDGSERNFESLLRFVSDSRATVIFGAGLGARAGLPGWTKLASMLCEEAGMTPPASNVTRTVIRAIDLAASQLQDKYLETLRRLLSPPGLTMPAIYESLSRIPFRAFGTLNLDELLFKLATVLHSEEESSVWCYYPGGSSWDKRYFYLHGRVASAENPKHLVLRTDDYIEAYNVQSGRTRRALRDLLDNPTVFVGSSLQDRDIDVLLREIDEYRWSIETVGGLSQGRFREDPPWFAILPANPAQLVPEAFKDVSTPDRVRAVAEEKASQMLPLRAIWYEYDERHLGLDELIRRLEARTQRSAGSNDEFLARADELEALARIANPLPDQVARVGALLSVRASQRHFFKYADPVWLQFLWDGRFLPRPIEPTRGSDGGLYSEAWEAELLVVRAASSYPDKVLEVLGQSTRNPLAHLAFVRALNALPADYISEGIKLVGNWLDAGRASAAALGYPLMEFLGRLIKSDRPDDAVALFDQLVRWRDDHAS